jgi:hypothetical protein
MNWEDFTAAVEQAGLEPVDCGHHWRIVGGSIPVDVWPPKPFRLRYASDASKSPKPGTLRMAIALAGVPQKSAENYAGHNIRFGERSPTPRATWQDQPDGPGWWWYRGKDGGTCPMEVVQPPDRSRLIAHPPGRHFGLAASGLAGQWAKIDEPPAPPGPKPPHTEPLLEWKNTDAGLEAKFGRKRYQAIEVGHGVWCGMIDDQYLTSGPLQLVQAGCESARCDQQ